MVSCVASVEFQLRVADSPLLMEVGLACRVTVGRAAAGAGAGGCGGGGATFFGPHPKRKTTHASAVSKPARQSQPEARCMRFLLNIHNKPIPVFLSQAQQQ